MIWNFFIGCWRKNNSISWGNRTIISLYHNNFIHLSEEGLPGWVFDKLTRSGGDGGLGPFNHLTVWYIFSLYGGYFISNIKHCYYVCLVHYILLSVLFTVLKKWSVFFFGNFCLWEFFWCMHMHANGIFPAVQLTYSMFVDDY